MRCLVVTNTERMLLLFFVPHIKLLINMGYEVSVATSIKDSEKIKEQLPEVTLHHIPFTRNLNPIQNVKVYKATKRLLEKEDYDLIHVHTPLVAFLVRMAVHKEQQVIYTAHGFHFHENGSKVNNGVYLYAEKIMASRTTKLIVINEEDRMKALTILPSEKVHYINGVGIDSLRFNPKNFKNAHKERIRNELGITENTKVITHLAEFNGNKRQIDIVLAAERLTKKYQDFVILLIGDGPLKEEIKREIRNRGLDRHVRCLGYRRDVEAILSITDIGLLVSIREGLPKSVMEMMAMEIPLIVTNIRGNRDLVHEGENGYLIPVKNPNDLMKSCLALIQNDTLRKKMGENGRNEIVTKFDLQIVLEETRRVYESFDYHPPVQPMVNKRGKRQLEHTP